MIGFDGASPLQMWCVDLPPITKGMPVAGGVRVMIGRSVVYSSPVSWNGDHILHNDPVRIGLTYRPENTEGRVEILALIFPMELIHSVLAILGSGLYRSIHVNRNKNFATGDDGVSVNFNFDTLETRQIDNRVQDHN